MANVTLNISGDSQEVIAVIRSLAQPHEPGHGRAAAALLASPFDGAAEMGFPNVRREHSWTSTSARDTRNSVSNDAQRLLDALVQAPDHQMHIDEIYNQLDLDRYGLIGARRSISAALRRNFTAVDANLLTTRDRRVTLNSEYALAISADPSTETHSAWGNQPQYS